MLPPNTSAGASIYGGASNKGSFWVQHPHQFVHEFVGDPLLRASGQVSGGGGGGGRVVREEEVVYAARGFTGVGPSRVDLKYLQSLPHASSCRCSRCRATSAQTPQGLQGLQTGTAKNGSAAQNSSMVPHMPGVHNAVHNAQNLHEPTHELRQKMVASLLSPPDTEGQSVVVVVGGGGSLYLPPSPASSLHAKVLKSPLFS
jgi:hypothetical protein